MTASEIAQIVGAITTFIAVIVGPMIQLRIANRQLRASVVSANRQQWINALRDDIADFLAKQIMVRSLHAKEYADDKSFPRYEEMMRLAYKIQLLINPKETDHAELVKLIFDLANIESRTTESPQIIEVNRITQQIVDLSQTVLRLIRLKRTSFCVAQRSSA